MMGSTIGLQEDRLWRLPVMESWSEAGESLPMRGAESSSETGLRRGIAAEVGIAREVGLAVEEAAVNCVCVCVRVCVYMCINIMLAREQRVECRYTMPKGHKQLLSTNTNVNMSLAALTSCVLSMVLILPTISLKVGLLVGSASQQRVIREYL